MHSLGMASRFASSVTNHFALDHVTDAKPNQIATPQLAVDGKVEKRKFPGSMIQLKPNPDCPDFFQL